MAGTTHPIATQCINSLNFIDGMIKRRTEGLTQEDTMRQLPFPANCMNWNLGHLMVYRARILAALDDTVQPDEAEFALYGAGSEPLTDPAKAMPLETLLARLEKASARLIAALEQAPAERLDAIYNPERGMTLADWLNFYVIFHESYHAGQLEILQELALAEK